MGSNKRTKICNRWSKNP